MCPPYNRETEGSRPILYPESSGFLVSGATPGRLWGHRKNSNFLIGCSVTVSIVLPQKSCGNKKKMSPESLLATNRWPKSLRTLCTRLGVALFKFVGLSSGMEFRWMCTKETPLAPLSLLFSLVLMTWVILITQKFNVNIFLLFTF